MTQQPSNLANMPKPDLRRHFRDLRDMAAGRDKPDRTGKHVADLVAEQYLAATGHPAGTIIAGYWSMRNELDPRPLLAGLAAAGCVLALPAIVERDSPLVFRHWTPGDDLVEGAFGTHEPAANAKELQPHIILLPLLAFDHQGYRLGYGGGYYDRTLDATGPGADALAVGLAFAAQETEKLPHEAHDRKLHQVVTEQETRTFV